MSDLTTAAWCPVPETRRPSSPPLAFPLTPSFICFHTCLAVHPGQAGWSHSSLPLSICDGVEGGGTVENRLERNRKRGMDDCTNVYVVCGNEGHGLSDDGWYRGPEWQHGGWRMKEKKLAMVYSEVPLCPSVLLMPYELECNVHEGFGGSRRF